uniref:sn-glycerol-3-phosphate transport system permease protein UgpA n=1 Tax=Dictyoglomus thermophilum TaxID=14 RepID=A0A7C3RVZ6_DICTH
MKSHPVFRNKILPLILITPQLLITIIFFIWPSLQALYLAFVRTDPFGLSIKFVGLANFVNLFSDKYYIQSITTTILFSLIVTLISIPISLLLAVMVEKPIYFKKIFRTLLIWPYSLASSVAAVLWILLFQPSIGLITKILIYFGIQWNYILNGTQAIILITLVATWKQISYNFIFFLSGLQSIPKSMIEAAEIDGANSKQIFWKLIFPLLSPTTFFLLIMNLTYAFFDTFGIIDALTKGGPGKATETLTYKVYVDGIVNFNLSSSATQSVVLLILVSILTALQFRYLDKRVIYQG